MWRNHDYNEGLCDRWVSALVTGREQIKVGAGQMYLVEAGTAHAVLEGSHGTLVILDV